MLLPIMPAYVQGSSGAPSVRGVDYPAGQTFTQGAVMIADTATGLTKEAAATPVLNIAGIALQPVDSAPGYGMANSPTNVTYRRQAISLAVATRVSVFKSSFVNASAVPIAPAQTDVYTKYGASKQGGVWVVDKALTGASACVEILEIDISNQLVYFKFLEATLATP